jgi:plasmid stability protein
MHRTQVLLEEWQYEALKARAQREGRSISGLLRDILQSQLGAPRPRKRRLAEIEGLAEDQTATGREHDRFLYGPPRR